METLSAATARLQAKGYVKNFIADTGARLRCAECDTLFAAKDVREDELLRFEGTSDPGDETILLALSCPKGHKGLYASAFGPYAGPLEAEILQAIHEHLGNRPPAGVTV